MKYSVLFVFTIHSLNLAFGVILPETWKRCKVSATTDLKRNRCIEEAITQVIKELDDNGEESLNVKDIDPMLIKKMSIGERNKNSPVSLAIDFYDMDLLGLSNFKMKSITGNLSSPENWSIRIQGYMKNMIMLGNYKIDGKVLLLSIVGSGKCNVTYDEVQADGTIYGKQVIKDGVEYLKLTNQTLTLGIKRFYVHLDNLFNGDKILGDAMNNILNENWSLVYDELRPSMERALAKQFVKYSKPILEKIPFKDIFITE